MQFPPTVQVHFGLADRPYTSWPPEARRVANGFLTRPRCQAEYLAVPQAKRHAWLAGQVEARLAAPVPSDEQVLL